MMNPVIFREYDIRGVYKEHFDEDFANLLGRAFSTFLERKQGPGPKTVTIGYDARLSSPSLADALSAGFLSCGVNVIRIGQVTTPMSYFSTFAVEGVSGAVMITGSHNPPNYNGFKISCGKSTIYGAEILELHKIIVAKDFLSRPPGKQTAMDLTPLYLERYKKEFSSLKPLKVVFDCGNGAAGVIARKLYEQTLGLNATFLFEEPDGTFPNHHPDPTVAENLVDLIKKVKETGAVAGIGFDGDADRIGLVDHRGEIVPGDEMIALLSRSILKTSPGQKIIADVKCSDRLFADVTKHGGVPVMWKSGHSLVKEKIKMEKSPFGGELSGHLFFADRNYGYDDALYAGLRVLEILSQTGKTIPYLLADLPSAFNTPEIRIDTTEEKKHLIVDALKRRFDGSTKSYQTNLIDGIRISFPDGWALARASNTQPVLVLRFEATSSLALEKIQAQFEDVVKPLL